MRADSQPAHWLADFHDALSARDKIRLQEVFLEDRYWRDFSAFTWNIITLEGRAPVLDMLLARLGEVKPEQWQIESVDAPGDEVGAWFSFETAVGRGKLLTDLTQTFEMKVSEMINGLSRASSAMERTAQSMSTTATSTNRPAGHVASASEQTSCNVQTVASDAEELTSSIAEIGLQVSSVDSGCRTRRQQRSAHR